MLFKYNGFDKSGSKVKGKLEAKNLLNAKSQLKSKNIIITSISEDSYTVLDKLKLIKKTKIKPLVLANISQDISLYLDSGISLLNGIKLLNERYKNDKKLNPFFNSLVTYLDEGKNFYTALSMQNVIQIPAFYLQSIKISENGGILASVLLELATYLKEQDKINKKISSSMAYPMFIIAVSFLMVGFMLSFIVPKITAIFEKNQQELPNITQFVIGAGNFVNNNYQFILFFTLFVMMFFSYSMKKYPKFKYKVDSLLLRLPFIGKLIEVGELSRFSYMNSILIKSGVPVVQSFKLSSDILKNSVIKELFSSASTKVVEGENLSKILQNSKIYKIDPSFIQSVAIGEDTSKLSQILQNQAKSYTIQNEDKIGVFLTLLEPMFMLIVGGIIGFIVVAMLLPIFSMSLG